MSERSYTYAGMCAWPVAPLPAADVKQLASQLSIREVTARCLLVRGISSVHDARSFLSPKLSNLRPPEGLPDLAIAMDRLTRALANQEKIGCFGDYDVDGITSAALCTQALRQMAGQVATRVANRDLGYGFGTIDVDWFIEQGCTVIISCDCGTSDIATIHYAKTRGVDVIIIDHHTVPSSDEISAHPAHALINPFRPDSHFPFRGLASVGLSFYVMQSLRSRLRSEKWFAARPEPDARTWLDLVAVGTVADLVPLSHENRILTSWGLKLLGDRVRPGFRALLNKAEISSSVIDERHIGFRMAPRLNAPGRLGDAAPALALLLADDDDAATRAMEQVEKLNDSRRLEQNRIMEEAFLEVDKVYAQGEPACLVIAKRGWPSGVVGIVAARLVDKYKKPAFVLGIADNGQARGSARTCGGANVYNMLSQAAALLERFGGHAAAAGLTVQESQLDALREVLQREAAQAPPQVESGACDADAMLHELDHTAAQELAQLAPFGKNNSAPSLRVSGLRVHQAKKVGDGSHLKFDFADTSGRMISGIGFGLGNGPWLPTQGQPVWVRGNAIVSTFSGSPRVELQVEAIAPGENA